MAHITPRNFCLFFQPLYLLLPTLKLLLLVLASLSAHAIWAQEIDDEEPAEFLPGLMASYRWQDHSERSLDEDILFDWRQIPPLTQIAPASDFSVIWKGQLQARENGQFQLSLLACGSVKVMLAGKEIISGDSTEDRWYRSGPLDLRFGYHDLQVEFARTNGKPRVSLFWSGPTFALEPISSRSFFHRNPAAPSSNSTPATAPAPDMSLGQYALGETLSRGLRCGACHELETATNTLSAPALTHLQDNLRPSWLVERLTAQANADDENQSALGGIHHMPHFSLPLNDALAISAALFAASAESKLPGAIEPQLQRANKDRPKKEPAIRTQAQPSQGEIAFVSIGCVACHQVGQLGRTEDVEHHVFGGGDLTSLAAKRTSNFIKRWLDNPALVNADHRMPLFELTLLERLDLAAYLSQLGADVSRNDSRAAGDARRGIALIAEHRCGACHQLPAKINEQLQSQPLAKTRLSSASNWDAGCLTTANAQHKVPGFGLTVAQRQSLKYYLTNVNRQSDQQARGGQLMKEHNCLACHSRELVEGLKSQLPAIVAAVPGVAPRLAAISPPSLTAVGDKYHAAALKTVIARQAPPLRPWLDVRMPKFRLGDSELDLLANHLIAHDRIPDGAESANRLPLDQLPSDAAARLAAGRLVTADGFGCQSCHPIGAGEPPKVDLNARGTNLAMLGERVRPEWFSRWVRNPARIVPRMEMPAIQTAVKGVLNDSLDKQLAALWTTLNTRDFRPPRAAPVRALRTHNLEDVADRAWLLTDVLETPSQVYLRPMLIGLPNRQNFLFDLQAGNLATWWLGDTAHQHTRGKSWYWEPGAIPLEGNLVEQHADATSSPTQSALQPLEQFNLVDASGTVWKPSPLGQFAVRFDSAEHIDSGLQWQGRIHLTTAGSEPAAARWLTIKQTITALARGTKATSQCLTQLSGLLPGDKVLLVSGLALHKPPAVDDNGQWKAELQGNNTLQSISSAAQLVQRSPHGIELSVPAADAKVSALGSSPPSGPSSLAGGKTISWSSVYSSPVPTDSFAVAQVPELVMQPTPINLVPGFEGLQLPLPATEMPISFAWDENGRFYAGSLKGRVLEVLDNNHDGLPETYAVISDEFPTPYGLFASAQGIDALAKFALIRLTPPKVAGIPYKATVVADGWGYTADYHDWAVGLERDDELNYYMALPCQQDDRSEAAAYLRGSALKLVPSESPDEPRQYRIEPFAAGLRFPMGIALNPNRELFTTDNQGNYNPFNELNHLRPGKRYGFINKLENKDGFSPPFESPAVNLPHPWVRSVNGMCFLQTPAGMRSDMPHFGPYEGHLIGCEMNGLSLVRMSLQKVGDTYQGAAYMFSRPVRADEANFEGPIVCKVSPQGDLMVGNLKDSGWSGGQNTGSIIRLRPNGNIPLGIAEVRATSSGFEVDFTQPVDAIKGAKIENYQLRSYQRISTPAYGGDDQDDRTERIESVRVSADRRRVTLDLASLRQGFVYELNLASVGTGAEELFPNQAHYTMRAIPE